MDTNEIDKRLKHYKSITAMFSDHSPKTENSYGAEPSRRASFQLDKSN